MAAKGHRLTSRQLQLLRYYRDHGFQESDREICRALGMNPRRPGALSRVHNVLYIHGYIGRGPRDYRRHQVTERGLEALREHDDR